MKTTLIISLAVVAAMGSNVFALQIAKGKLTDHKEWSTGRAKISFLAKAKSSQNMPHQAVTLNTGVIDSQAVAATAPVAGRIGEPVTITNQAYIRINNSSDAIKQYFLTSSVCAMVAEDTKECVYSRDIVELEPGGSVYEDRSPELTLTYIKAGNYTTYVTTDFQRHEGNENIATISTSSATVTIS